jgi:prevent-host-death family protein
MYYIVTLEVQMLNFTEDIRPISYIKSHTAEMIKQISDKKNPIVITQNGEAKAVLIDVESYQGLIDSINLLKLISIGENDIKAGKTIKMSDLKKKVSKILI